MKSIMTDRELAYKRLEEIKKMKVDNAETARKQFNEALEQLEEFLLNYEQHKKEIFDIVTRGYRRYK